MIQAFRCDGCGQQSTFHMEPPARRNILYGNKLIWSWVCGACDAINRVEFDLSRGIDIREIWRKWRADNEVQNPSDLPRSQHTDTDLQLTRLARQAGIALPSAATAMYHMAAEQRARNIAIGIDPAATEQEYTSTIEGVRLEGINIESIREHMQQLANGIEEIDQEDNYTTGESEEPAEGYWPGQQNWRDDNPVKQRSGSDKPRERTSEGPQLPVAKWTAVDHKGREYDYAQFGQALDRGCTRDEFIGLQHSIQAALDLFFDAAQRGRLGITKTQAAVIAAHTIEAFRRLGIPVRDRR